VDSIVADLLEGTDGASFPFWSADGQRFGFFAAGRLKIFTLATREVRDLAAAPEGHGGAWNDRDEIVFAPGRASALQLIHASGGELTQVTTIGSSFKEGHAWPSFLPDGRHFFYTDSVANQNRYGIYVGDLRTHESKRILGAYSSAAYGAGGFLLYVNDSLMAQRFDPVHLTIKGKAMPIAAQVLQRYDAANQADFSISRSGNLAVRSTTRYLNELRWIDRDTGRSIGSVATPGYYSNPTLSPDGRQLIATVDGDDGASNLWSYDLSTGQATRISFGRTADFAPLFAPGGGEILFGTPRGLFRQPAGGGNPVPSMTARMLQVPDSWSTDGYVTVTTISQQTKADVWVWQIGDHPHATPLIDSAANEGQSRISPDGRYIAYVSDASGNFEVYVQAFPVANGRWQVSAGGGADPLWSRNGHELFYVAADRHMMAVPVSTRSAFTAGRPTRLFKTQLDTLWMDTRNHYDVSPDGRRFVIIAPATERREAPFTLLANWSRSLQR
jgi:Tol biopolymer transport system component